MPAVLLLIAIRFSGTGADATPENPLIQKALRGLLTPFLAEKLADEDPVPVCFETSSGE